MSGTSTAHEVCCISCLHLHGTYEAVWEVERNCLSDVHAAKLSSSFVDQA